MTREFEGRDDKFDNATSPANHVSAHFLGSFKRSSELPTTAQPRENFLYVSTPYISRVLQPVKASEPFTPLPLYAQAAVSQLSFNAFRLLDESFPTAFVKLPRDPSDGVHTQDPMAMLRVDVVTSPPLMEVYAQTRWQSILLVACRQQLGGML